MKWWEVVMYLFATIILIWFVTLSYNKYQASKVANEKARSDEKIEAAKKKIEREKLVDKMKHARMLDRAKVRKIKNRSKANA